MALSGTDSAFDGPVVPEVNISRNGSSPVSSTGSQAAGKLASSAQKLKSPRTMPCPLAPATVTMVGQSATSASFERLTASVTTTLAPELLRRCSMALGPNAVNSG
ncbi:hypothetical protein D3C81_1772300 [compost metagenome]